MSLKHLGPGSQEPPKVDGKLRLYSMEYCPFAQRTRIVLLVKNLPHDIVNINLRDKPEWYFKLHPDGKVPSLDTGSDLIIESLVISDYLDEKYPEPPLYPKDPEAKKRDQELIKKIDPFTSVFARLVYGFGAQKSPEEFAEELSEQYNVFETELAARGTPFFGGNKPGMVDYMLWPWIEREGVLKLAQENLPFDTNQFPLLKKWHKALLKDPAAKATYNTTESHSKVAQSGRQKIPLNYDEI